MIKANGISKSYGAGRVFAGVSFVVNDGERAGVVGPNGSGKTTLLRVLAGVERADAGAVTLPPGARAGFLRQGYAGDGERAAGEVFPLAFAAAAGEARVVSLAAALADARDAPARDAIAREYELALAAISADATTATRDAWAGLGLRAIARDERVGVLSGGEQTKLGLVELAATQADVLLLDEPTNNLDLDALEWLDEFLAGFDGPVLMASHDRALLNAHATAIFEIDPATGQLTAFAGDYESYVEEKARRREALWDRFRAQEERGQRVKREIRSIKANAARFQGTSKNDFYRRKGKKVARRAVVLERRLERELQADERIAKPIRRAYTVKAEMPDVARSGERMLTAADVVVRIGGRVLLDGVSLEIGWGERVVLTGANGSGKTTLLRALVGELPTDAGSVRVSGSTRVGYLPQNENSSSWREGESPVSIVRAAAALDETEARRFLHRFLFSGDDALRPVTQLSYGERRRLALARLVLGGANLLLLDEPTNHLDIPSREAFELALDAYEGAVLAVTHDRYLIGKLGGRMVEL